MRMSPEPRSLVSPTSPTKTPPGQAPEMGRERRRKHAVLASRALVAIVLLAACALWIQTQSASPGIVAAPRVSSWSLPSKVVSFEGSAIEPTPAPAAAPFVPGATSIAMRLQPVARTKRSPSHVAPAAPATQSAASPPAPAADPYRH
jgi:hypothetical protein